MPISSIYSPADLRYNNPAFNQNTGSMFPSASNLGTLPGGTTTGTGGTGSLPGQTSGPDLTSITNLVNQLNRDAQTQANQARIPGAAGLEAKSSANIGQEMAGQVPLDVINLLQQQGAERGVGRLGGVDNANTNAAYLQALGLTSIGQQEQGQRDLALAYGRNPVAPIFDPSKMLLTPYQAGDLAYKNAALNRGLISDFLSSGGAFPQGPRHYGGGGPVYQGDSSGGGDQSWFPTAGGTPSPPYPGGSSGGGIGSLSLGPPPGTFTGGDSSYYDPFAAYGGGAFTGFEPPPNTVTTDTSSTYDPFQQYYGG